MLVTMRLAKLVTSLSSMRDIRSSSYHVLRLQPLDGPFDASHPFAYSLSFPACLEKVRLRRWLDDFDGEIDTLQEDHTLLCLRFGYICGKCAVARGRNRLRFSLGLTRLTDFGGHAQ